VSRDHVINSRYSRFRVFVVPDSSTSRARITSRLAGGGQHLANQSTYRSNVDGCIRAVRRLLAPSVFSQHPGTPRHDSYG